MTSVSLEVSVEELLATARKYGTNPDSSKTYCFALFDKGFTRKELAFALPRKGIKLTRKTLKQYWNLWKKAQRRRGSRESSWNSKENILRILRAELPYLRERFGVRRLALYGSFARGDQGGGSDLDLLVEFSRPPGLDFVALAYYLEERLGRSVDLATFEVFQHARQKPGREALLSSIQEDLVDVEAPAR